MGSMVQTLVRPPTAYLMVVALWWQCEITSPGRKAELAEGAVMTSFTINVPGNRTFYTQTPGDKAHHFQTTA